ncbi:DEAD/DEAH box helicase [Pseudonocardiaceae bacterium YIM PH 21723]|nr:DEAD/DEAH box helicase [Pseudonocardiaceae bacterium YIM PH 21723]
MRKAITLTLQENPQPTEDSEVVALDHSTTGIEQDVDTSHPLQAVAPPPPLSPTFAELGVRPEIVQALNEAGIERTFAIQELTLPIALPGDDVIGQARTGTGKTLGFGVPLLQRIVTPGDGTPQALVVVPTRELCLQVTHDLADAGKHMNIRILSVYGGRPYEPQISALRKGVDVIIGTPGRLLDLAEQRHLVLGKIRMLVLDEADEMLDLGFLPDVERILRMVPDERQTMLFSATMPGPVITLARTFLKQPTHVRAEEQDSSAVHERTTQFVYRAHAMDKTELLAKVLQAKDRKSVMIFTKTKRTAQKVSDELAERGFAVASVHGDLGQGAREQALRAFRSGKIDVLVATDVAARGIDVEGVTHVVNYQCPEDEKTYVHRIGRTGRAGRTGVAITLVDWDEMSRWKMISDALNLGKPEPVETYSTSKHLFTDLDIPADVSGRLPLGQRTREGLKAEPIDDEGDSKRGRGRGRSRDGESAAPSTATRSRSRTRKRTRAGGAAEATNAPADEAGQPRPARTRTRRRTRSGDAGEQQATPQEAVAAPVPVTPSGNPLAPVQFSAPGTESTPEAPNTAAAASTRSSAPRRRRRRRTPGAADA